MPHLSSDLPFAPVRRGPRKGLLCLWATLQILCVLAVRAQTPVRPPAQANPDVIAGIAVNYDEGKVGAYTLPDPLRLADGRRVHDARTWTAQRRPEILRLFARQQYGTAPGRPAGESFEVAEHSDFAFGGQARRRQVTIHLSKDPSWPAIHLLEYIPAKARKPVPLLLCISFNANLNSVDDPGVLPGEVWDAKTKQRVTAVKGRGFGKLEIAPLLDAGFGVAIFYYGDLEPDFPGGLPLGIRARYLRPGQTAPAPDEWGAIAAWAWGMSRAMDYLETDPDVDAKRVAIHGVSRLGKTVMWAGANDQRFAAVIASCSGEGGAALSRRNYGETVGHLVAPSRYPYQFAINYAQYGGHVDTMPMDANLLVSLIAPRPLLLQTGDHDDWSDPKGEFLAEVAAGPVYRLLGRQDLGTTVWPAANQPIFHDLGYFMHEGGHGTVPSDWTVYADFLKKALQPAS